MLSSDFSQGGKSYIFKGNTTIWGNSDVYVMVYCGGNDGEECEFLSANMGFINKRIEWIDKNRPFLNNVMIDNNMVELTEEWIQKAKDAKEVGNGVYALLDEQKVYLPLKKEAFLMGLCVSGMGFNFEPDEQKPSTDLYIHCTPDYFMDQACIKIEINYDDSIEECVILSAYSPDKPW